MLNSKILQKVIYLGSSLQEICCKSYSPSINVLTFANDYIN